MELGDAPPLRPRLVQTVLAVVLAVLVVVGLSAGCSSSSGKSGKDTPTTPAVCTDYDALKKSLSDLASINVISAGVGGLKQALNNVGTKLTALKNSAKKQYATQIDDLSTAVGDLRSTVGNLSNNDLSGSLSTIGTEIAAVATAGRALGSAVTSTCPTSSSS
jgi:hypothetical protein